MKIETSDFKPGDAVRYIPHHANGDPTHPSCENGIVSSTNEIYVFVKFLDPLNTTTEAVHPSKLIKEHY